ncbi:ROK family protein [Sinomicrobium sp. M5D2P17]
MNHNEFDYIGVDIGGSHITVARVDSKTRKYKPDSYQRQRVNPHGSTEEIIKNWAGAIHNTLRKPGNTYMGIAIPGPFDYKNGISYMKGQEKYDRLYNLNIKELLAKELNISEDRIDFVNDAAGFLQGELLFLGHEKVRSVIGLTLGTGLGSAYTIDGVAFDAGLWRFPFGKGISEDYLCTRWFVNSFYQATGEKVKDLKDLLDRFGKHPQVVNIFRHFSENLAAFILQFVKMRNPEMIIIGGNMIKAEQYFLTDVIEILKKHRLEIPVITACLGEKAALVGAVYNWISKNLKL